MNYYKTSYEPPRDKTNEVSVRPAKTQISLDTATLLVLSQGGSYHNMNRYNIEGFDTMKMFKLTVYTFFVGTADEKYIKFHFS